MILCFSGTGNSRRVADEIQQLLGDEVVRLSPGYMNQPERLRLAVDSDRLIWVMPTHGWGLPRAVVNVLNKMTLDSDGLVKHYLVLTCGDDVGLTARQWRSMMRRRHWLAVSAFSVQMPNTYVCLPGFDVDPKDVAEAKLEAMPARVKQICDVISSEEIVDDVVRGAMPWLKSKVAYPFFTRFLATPAKFGVNEQCEGCGKCARNCPFVNIKIVDGRPQWGDRCTFCLRCYHGCPCQAITHGRSTRGKGQYLCPGYSLKS